MKFSTVDRELFEPDKSGYLPMALTDTLGIYVSPSAQSGVYSSRWSSRFDPSMHGVNHLREYERPEHQNLNGFVGRENSDRIETRIRMELAVLAKHRILRNILKHGEAEIDSNVHIGRVRGPHAVYHVADMLRYLIEAEGGQGKEVVTPNGKTVKVTPPGKEILERMIPKYIQ